MGRFRSRACKDEYPIPWAYMNTLDGEGGEGWLTEGIATENFPPRGARVSGYLIGWLGGGEALCGSSARGVLCKASATGELPAGGAHGAAHT